MKRLVATAALTAALLLPGATAHAQLVRTEPCPPGKVGRTIHIGDNISAYNCYPVPGTTVDTSDATAVVRVTDCPPGYTGYVVQAWNEKRGWYDVVVFCIPWGP